MKSLLFSLLPALMISCNAQATKSNEPKTGGKAEGNGVTVSHLSQSILIIFQATNGDYWFGSDVDGVYRYNGKTILHYTEKEGLSNNRIRSIQEDKKGTIYFATLSGVDKFDGQKISNIPVIKSNSPAEHWKLQADDLWFCMPGKNGDKGPYRYDGEHLYQLEFPKHYLADNYFKNNPDKPWSPYEVYSIYKDSKGDMWFGTAVFGLCRYNGKSFNWLYEDQLTTIPNGGSFGIRSMIEDQEGSFWFCNTNYRYVISKDSIKENGKTLVKYERKKGIETITATDGSSGVYFMSALVDKEKDLWMATYNEGIWQFDGHTAKHYSVKNGLKDATVFSIYKDKRDNLWLGTHESGVYKFNGKTFEKFTLNEN